MNNTPETNKNEVKSFDEHTQEALDVANSHGGRPPEEVDSAAAAKRILKQGLAVVGAGAVVGGVVGVNALASEHTDEVLKNMEGQTDPNIQYDFENGPLPPEETEPQSPMNPAPSPSPSEIPSLTQKSSDIQLPTIPSPKQP